MSLIKGIYFAIADTAYEALVKECRVINPTPTVWDGSTDAKVIADVPTGQRTINIVARQDWKDPAGICQYLLENEGKTATILFAAPESDGVYFSVEAVLSAPDIGGALNAYGEFTLALPCTKPAPASAPTPPAEG